MTIQTFTVINNDEIDPININVMEPGVSLVIVEDKSIAITVNTTIATNSEEKITLSQDVANSQSLSLHSTFQLANNSNDILDIN